MPEYMYKNNQDGYVSKRREEEGFEEQEDDDIEKPSSQPSQDDQKNQQTQPRASIAVMPISVCGHGHAKQAWMIVVGGTMRKR